MRLTSTNGALGIQVRTYAGRLSLLLRERTTVAALAERLGEVGLRSLALHPASLIHIFLELGAEGAAVRC